MLLFLCVVWGSDVVFFWICKCTHNGAHWHLSSGQARSPPSPMCLWHGTRARAAHSRTFGISTTGVIHTGRLFKVSTNTCVMTCIDEVWRHSTRENKGASDFTASERPRLYNTLFRCLGGQDLTFVWNCFSREFSSIMMCTCAGASNKIWLNRGTATNPPCTTHSTPIK